MSDKFTFTIDGVEVEATPGQTILEAADAAGIYVPRLCHLKGLVPLGACRVCTVYVNGRPQAACVQPAAANIVVDNGSEKLSKFRKNLIEMLFAEGNHFCMFCEKSGNCELQALGYRFGVLAPKFPYQFPKDRNVDLSHPDVMTDFNRCVLCGRCVRASKFVDGKHVFQFIGRGFTRRIGLDSRGDLSTTKLAASDKAAEACPVGCIMKKRIGFAVPVGRRLYDWKPIGSDIEANKAP